MSKRTRQNEEEDAVASEEIEASVITSIMTPRIEQESRMAWMDAKQKLKNEISKLQEDSSRVVRNFDIIVPRKYKDHIIRKLTTKGYTPQELSPSGGDPLLCVIKVHF